MLCGEFLQWTHKIVDVFTGVHDALKVKELKSSELPDGKISVSAQTPPGTRLDYRQLVQEEGFAFKGTRYNPGTGASITGKGLLKNAIKGARFWQL